MPNYLTNDTDLTSIANAIRAKTGGSSPIVYPNEFVSEIGNIPTGGGGGAVEEKQINFIDYDGTILHSYTKEEINAMSSESDLPSNPSHTGLTAQGWNWTLAQIKAQLIAMPDAPVWVGQMYVTDDGKNRIYIHVIDKALCSMRLNFAVNGAVVVDWGDNTATETVTGTSLSTRLQTEVHTYSSVGDYVITLGVTTGSMAFYSSSNYGLLSHSTSSNGNNNKAFNNMVAKVELGVNTSLGNSAFYYCYSLGSVTIPSSVTSIKDSTFFGCSALRSFTIPSGAIEILSMAFQNCYSLGSIAIPSSVADIRSNAFQNCHTLGSVTLPSGVTYLGSYVFYYCHTLGSVTLPSGITAIDSSMVYGCHALRSVTIPSSVTNIGNSAFQDCYSLGSVTIPSSVTRIGSSVFYDCAGLQEIHFKSSTPPTVTSAMTFYNLPTYCKIYVPTGSLSAYTSASNYPSSSTYTYIEE